MSSLDDVMKKVSAAANRAVRKSSDMAETGKLKVRINNEEKKLKELYEQVGRAVYEDCAAGGPMPDYVRDDCVEIYNHLQAIAEMEAHIETLRQEEDSRREAGDTAGDDPGTDAGEERREQ